jgi:hypothetical protein
LSPGRRTNWKNLRSCQRTILLYSFYFFSQSKIRICKYTYFQSSARRSQPHDRIWCNRLNRFRQKPRPARLFAELRRGITVRVYPPTVGVSCENPANAASHDGFERNSRKISGDGPGYATSIFSSRNCLSASSVPDSWNEFVMAALPFSTLVITYEQPNQCASA